LSRGEKNIGVNRTLTDGTRQVTSPSFEFGTDDNITRVQSSGVEGNRVTEFTQFSDKNNNGQLTSYLNGIAGSKKGFAAEVNTEQSPRSSIVIFTNCGGIKGLEGIKRETRGIVIIDNGKVLTTGVNPLSKDGETHKTCILGFSGASQNGLIEQGVLPFVKEALESMDRADSKKQL
jgi:hypothetical protein